MAIMTDPSSLLRLMTWLSPAFPVGSYSYSHGLEQAVENGLLADQDSVVAWISTILRHGGAWVDAVLFRDALRAVRQGNAEALIDAAERAEAWRGTAETALESHAQGQAFVTALAAGWPSAERDRWLALVPAPAYGTAVAIAAAAADIDEQTAMTAFLHAVASNLVSAAVRLIPLGQTDGQRAVRRLAETIPSVVAAARAVSADEVGTACPMVDWVSMRHETQYTRLFRS